MGGQKCACDIPGPGCTGTDDPTQFWLGWIASASVIDLFISPIPQVMCKVIGAKTTGQFADLPYLLSLTNCTLWVMYAIPQNLTQPFVVNAAGMALNITWLVIFMIYTDTRLMLALKILAVIAVCGATQGIYEIMTRSGAEQETAASVVGDIADVFNIGMYGSPLAAVGTVFATRSVETLPILMVSMTLVASALWGLYGKWIGDWHVGVPNDIGVLLAIVQIIVWLKFRNATPIDAARDKLVDGGNKVADETQA